jgi:CRISP-associated protein Cas1
MKPNKPPVMPLRNRISVFSVERGCVEVDGAALVVTDVRGVRAQLPVGASAVLMLEPGTTITHAAVKLCAENRTLIIWTGEAGVRLYSAGQEGAAHSYRLLRQARLALDPKSRLAVAREMYRMRFFDEPPQKRSIEQLRGMEGARVRSIYRQLAERHGVEWHGRDYDRSDWGQQDPVNRALSAANSCLYGVCHAAVLIAGYSAALGFIHTGYPLAFVHDLADLYKMEVAAPTAFRLAAEGGKNLDMRVRHELRDGFRRVKLLERLIPGIETLLDAGEGEKGMPEELGGCKAETARPEDAPWQRKPRLPEARVIAAELHADRPPAPPRPMPPPPAPPDPPYADDGLPF